MSEWIDIGDRCCDVNSELTRYRAKTCPTDYEGVELTRRKNGVWVCHIDGEKDSLRKDFSEFIEAEWQERQWIRLKEHSDENNRVDKYSVSRDLTKLRTDGIEWSLKRLDSGWGYQQQLGSWTQLHERLSRAIDRVVVARHSQCERDACTEPQLKGRRYCSDACWYKAVEKRYFVFSDDEDQTTIPGRFGDEFEMVAATRLGHVPERVAPVLRCQGDWADDLESL